MEFVADDGADAIEGEVVGAVAGAFSAAGPGCASEGCA